MSGEQKTTKRYYKSTGLMDILLICRDALCSKEIYIEKLHLTSKPWLLFIFQPRPSPSCCQWCEWWTDKSGQRFQSPTWVFRRKIENIDIYAFWSS